MALGFQNLTLNCVVRSRELTMCAYAEYALSNEKGGRRRGKNQEKLGIHRSKWRTSLERHAGIVQRVYENPLNAGGHRYEANI